MNKFHSQIKGDPIYSRHNGDLLGLIHDIIINPENGKVEAFWVRPATLPVDYAILLSESILSWGSKIYINDEAEIALPTDVIRIADILSRNSLFIGNTTVNESGQILGKVYDLSFDSRQFYLQSVYTAFIFLGFKFKKRIFSANSIIEVLPDKILVKDALPIKEELIELVDGQTLVES